jgi:hypothetical protein
MSGDFFNGKSREAEGDADVDVNIYDYIIDYEEEGEEAALLVMLLRGIVFCFSRCRSILMGFNTMAVNNEV